MWMPLLLFSLFFFPFLQCELHPVAAQFIIGICYLDANRLIPFLCCNGFSVTWIRF